MAREPNDLELRVIEAEWSEHCSYKSSKKLIKQLPRKGKHILIGPGSDAAAIDVSFGVFRVGLELFQQVIELVEAR